MYRDTRQQIKEPNEGSDGLIEERGEEAREGINPIFGTIGALDSLFSDQDSLLPFNYNGRG